MRRLNHQKAWPRLHVSDYMRLSEACWWVDPNPEMEPLYRIYVNGHGFEMLVAAMKGDMKTAYGLITESGEHRIDSIDLDQLEYMTVTTSDDYVNRDMDWKSDGRTLAEIYKELTSKDCTEIS